MSQTSDIAIALPSLPGLITQVASLNTQLAALNTSMTSVLARLAVLESAPQPTLPSFTAQPAITGTLQVGQVGAFSFGTVTNGTIASRQLLFQQSDGTFAGVGDASSGSIQWQTAGVYKLHVVTNNSSVYADSPAVTVTAASSSSRTEAPTLAFPTTNDDGSAYASNSNPPTILITIPATVDKTATQLRLFYDQLSSGAVTSNEIDITDLMAAADSETFTISGFANLTAGAFRAEADFKYNSDGYIGPKSNRITTTLAAKALPAATTNWGLTNGTDKSQYITVTETTPGNGDYRVGQGETSVGASQYVRTNQGRTDARFWEVICVARDANNPADIRCGIDDSNYTGSYSGFSDHGVKYNDTTPPFAAGDVFTVYASPASSSSANDGVLKVWLKGVLLGTVSHSYTNYRPTVCVYRGEKFRLNTGQEAFSYANVVPSGTSRYN